jgi:putative acetyltransferase
MADAVSLRIGGPADFDALGVLMFEAVRSGDSPYSEAQRAAWVAEPRRGADWHARLAGQHIVIAQAADGPVGFMTLADRGYVDFAYILPRMRGAGLFRRLFGEIADEAQRRGETRLWAHTSLMAEPAFAAMGFTVTRRETVAIGDQALARCEMERSL